MCHYRICCDAVWTDCRANYIRAGDVLRTKKQTSRAHDIVYDVWYVMRIKRKGKWKKRRYNVLIHRNNLTQRYWAGYGRLIGDSMLWIKQYNDTNYHDIHDIVTEDYIAHIIRLEKKYELKLLRTINGKK